MVRSRTIQRDEAPANLPVQGSGTGAPGVEREERYSLLEYLAVVMAFWLLCGLQLLIIWYLTGETTGLYFLFGFMGLGFTVVALFSWLHDLFYREELEFDAPMQTSAQPTGTGQS